jgi:hypothetical protein
MRLRKDSSKRSNEKSVYLDKTWMPVLENKSPQNSPRLDISQNFIIDTKYKTQIESNRVGKRVITEKS